MCIRDRVRTVLGNQSGGGWAENIEFFFYAVNTYSVSYNTVFTALEHTAKYGFLIKCNVRLASNRIFSDNCGPLGLRPKLGYLSFPKLVKQVVVIFSSRERVRKKKYKLSYKTIFIVTDFT